MTEELDEGNAGRRLVYMPLGVLKEASRNPKKHLDADIGKSIGRFGYVEPIVLDERTKRLVAGHGRLASLRKRLEAGEKAPDGIKEGSGDWLVPVLRGWASRSDTEAEAYLLASNQLVIGGGWDNNILVDLLKELDGAQALDGVGFSEADLSALLQDAAAGVNEREAAAIKLTEQFLVPPFTVLDARQGYWQERKRAWLALGITSEIGRGENLLNFSETVLKAQGKGRKEPNGHLSEKAQKSLGMYAAYGEADAIERAEGGVTGTSIFDPVLCELAYTWFSPIGGTVLDPFSGGSVRGLVAGRLGRRYVGIDLRAEQVEANRQQVSILRPDDPVPTWHQGDSREVLVSPELEDLQADLVFSCPPYADLEVYSDDPKDLSTMDYQDFVGAYRDIIAKAVAKLKPNRFACFVVGDLRDPKGFYRGFVPDTIEAFEDAGALFYNEGILVTAVGSLAMRVGSHFKAGRKLGKAHQNVLVFFKGDPKRIREELGELEVPAQLMVDVGPTADGFGEEMA